MPPLLIYQLSKLLNNVDEIVGFKITFLNFKHSYNQPPFSLIISPRPTFCLFQFLHQYLLV